MNTDETSEPYPAPTEYFPELELLDVAREVTDRVRAVCLERGYLCGGDGSEWAASNGSESR